MLAVALVLAAVAAGFALRGGIELLRLLVRPEVLLALLAADVAVFAFRAHCALDAYRSARRVRMLAGRPSRPAGGRAVAVLALLAFVALPHAVAAYYDVRSYDVLTSVFAAEEPVDLLPTSAPPEVGGPTSSLGPGFPVGGPEAPVAVAEKPPAARESYWRDRGRVTFLLIGGDAGPYRYGVRTDTMIVVSVSTDSGRAAAFGIPRNLTAVPLPPSARSELATFPEILNALWGYAEANPGLFPGARFPGPTALKETIGHLLGLRIDYFAAVDLRGFVELVDALGGVTVDVQRPVFDAGVSPPVEGEPPIVVDLPPGRHHLDGRLALGYVRTRWATSDYDRMHRQRCLVGALARQNGVGELLRAFPRLASTVKRFVLTDVPLKALPDLIELLAGLDPARMVGVSFAPPNYSTVPDVDAFRATVRLALRGEADSAVGLQTVEADCA
jgi:LCP family protein required for cell wall assembly